MCKCCNKLWRRLIDRQFASQLTAQASSPEIIIYRVTDPSPVQCSGSSVAAGAGRRDTRYRLGAFSWQNGDAKTNNQCYFCMNDVKTWYAWNKSKTCKKIYLFILFYINSNPFNSSGLVSINSLDLTILTDLLLFLDDDSSFCRV